MRLLLTCTLLAATLPAPAFAQAAETPAETAAAPARASKPKKICKKEEETGSRMALKKTCLTAAQWEERAETMRRDMLQRQRELNVQ